MRGRVEAERRAVARFERLSHVLLLPLPASDHREAADHRADLVMQEAARRGSDVDFIADAAHLQPIERLYRAVRLALRRAEGGEVVAADEVRRAFLHRLDVERNGNVPDSTRIE